MTLKIETDVNLKPFNTMAIPVLAKTFVSITSEAALNLLLAEKKLLAQSIFILGGGSNILLTQNFPGLIIHNCLKGITTIKESTEHVWLKVAAGENWHEFVMFCVKQNYGGVENLSLIPGTVGAAPIQNIGAYGAEVQDTVESLEGYELKTGKQLHFLKNECEFSYRDSVFKKKLLNQFIITHVTFKLNKFPQLNFSYGAIVDTLHSMEFQSLSVKVISEAVIKIRQSKLPDPKVLPNTGSFFKNPFVPIAHFHFLKTDYPTIPSYPIDANTVKIPAGWLIEQCGWKGKMLGNVGVYEKQALVLVNHSNGNAAELLALVQAIQQSVQHKFQIQLEPEVLVV